MTAVVVPIREQVPRLLVHYAPGVLAVLRRDPCPDHRTDHGLAHCDRGGTVLTVVGISGLEPGEQGWVLDRCWLRQGGVGVMNREVMLQNSLDDARKRIEVLIVERDDATESLSDEIEVLTQERDSALLSRDEVRAQLNQADKDLRLLEVQAALLETERDNALLAAEGFERLLLEFEANSYSSWEVPD